MGELGAGIGAGEAAGFALSPGEVVDLVLPFVRFGADRSDAQGFQSVLFVGSSLLVLAAWGLWRHKGLAAVGGVLGVLALGDAGRLFTWMHRWVPGASLFRFPIKFLSPLPVLLGLAVAAGFSAWEARRAAEYAASGSGVRRGVAAGDAGEPERRPTVPAVSSIQARGPRGV